MNNDGLNKSKRLAWWKVALLFLGLLLLITFLITLVTREKFFYNLAAGIIVSWVVALITYYFWAIYFYNVNMGWEDADWDKLEEKKNGQSGLLDDEPTKNPNAAETLGLPPGTVRATLALTLLVGAMALMIASLELPHKMEQNSLFIDNYEFLKTAFIMMVAFYFGNKSLDFIKNKKSEPDANATSKPSGEREIETLTSPVLGSEAKQVIKANQSPETADESETGSFDDKDAKG